MVKTKGASRTGGPARRLCHVAIPLPGRLTVNRRFQKATNVTGALAIAIAFLPGCKTTHPNAVLHFQDGTYVECSRGLEFGYRTVCHTERGTLTVPWDEIARYELR
jgi:hypothetical protein